MHRMTDEQIKGALDEKWAEMSGLDDNPHWRTIADAASDHSRDVTVATLDAILSFHCYPPTHSIRARLRADFPTAFAASTPQPPAPVKDEPALDERTVRACMEAVRVIRRENYYVPDDLPLDPKSRITDECVCALESLLPQPAPTLPTHYVDAAESSRPCRAWSIEEVRRRHGLLTPEEAWEAIKDHDTIGLRQVGLAGLRLAAKQGGGA